MRYSELRRKLRKLVCEPLRQAGGSHEIWWRPDSEFRTVIPNYPSKEIPKGTLRAILKDLGLTMKDLQR
ncbi:type II toxin-antitoxin system HicA family toxin [Chloroflexi bacterium TSY]|nr:type II toxin-antitoxin system HicA family toxin [Chloroflexi bacterium TSY]